MINRCLPFFSVDNCLSSDVHCHPRYQSTEDVLIERQFQSFGELLIEVRNDDKEGWMSIAQDVDQFVLTMANSRLRLGR